MWLNLRGCLALKLPAAINQSAVLDKRSKSIGSRLTEGVFYRESTNMDLLLIFMMIEDWRVVSMLIV